MTDEAAAAVITPGRMPIPDNSFIFDTTQTGPWATFGAYNKTIGMLTVNIDLSNQEDLQVKNRSAFCQPTTYCAWDSSNNSCGCKPGSDCTDSKVCALATKELDCQCRFSAGLLRLAVFTGASPDCGEYTAAFRRTDRHELSIHAATGDDNSRT